VDKAARVHKEQIKGEIRMRYGTLAAFEAAKKLPAGSVKDVLRGRSNARVENAIATFVKAPVQKLFPRRYLRDDSSTKVDNSRPKRPAHRLTAEAR
jgi:lambda repressor-like predicted transcriptional regulator